MGSTSRTSGNGAIYVNKGFSGHRIKTPKDGKSFKWEAETLRGFCFLFIVSGAAIGGI